MKSVSLRCFLLLTISLLGTLGCEKQIHEVRLHDRLLTPAPHTAPRPA